MSKKTNYIKIPYGSWYDDTELTLPLPASWKIHMLKPRDGPQIDEKTIIKALMEPIDTPTLKEMTRGKSTVAIAVDDITRPTPTDKILPIFLDELHRCGISTSAITIIIATGAHRSMSGGELRKKLGENVVNHYRIVIHDFLGQDIRFIGWLNGGPVYINRHFLDADLRFCLGCVLGHDETGFGGGAKMVVPGLAGRATIAHFHGALPPRPKWQIEAVPGVQDRRVWAEEIAEHIGIDAVLCTVVNSKRHVAGIYFGDTVNAHRQAAKQTLELGETIISRELIHKGDLVIANSYPLDSDPIQLGKTVETIKKIPVKHTLVIDAASDGIFYHGMGMGTGVELTRLGKNLYQFCHQPASIRTWLGSLKCALKKPLLTARLSYLTINHQSYGEFLKGMHDIHTIQRKSLYGTQFMLYSKKFPEWGFRQRYYKGLLYREWDEVIMTLSQKNPASAEVLVLPCVPLQFLKIT